MARADWPILWWARLLWRSYVVIKWTEKTITKYTKYLNKENALSKEREIGVVVVVRGEGEDSSQRERHTQKAATKSRTAANRYRTHTDTHSHMHAGMHKYERHLNRTLVCTYAIYVCVCVIYVLYILVAVTDWLCWQIFCGTVCFSFFCRALVPRAIARCLCVRMCVAISAINTITLISQRIP